MKTPDHQSIGWLRVLLAVLHLSMAAISFLRPHMIEIVLAYKKFGTVAPTTSWGLVMLVIGLGLLFLPRASAVLILWQAASATLFALLTILVSTGPTALTWDSAVFTCLTVSSAAVAYVTADQLFQRNGAGQKLRAKFRFRNAR